MIARLLGGPDLERSHPKQAGQEPPGEHRRRVAFQHRVGGLQAPRRLGIAGQGLQRME